MPTGMRILPKQERTEMLDALGRTRTELEKQIQARPCAHAHMRLVEI